MNNIELFTAALQLPQPWKVTDVQFVPDGGTKMSLHISIDFERGAKFTFFRENGERVETTAHDTIERKWRHLNFFQYEAYIHARIPRIRDGEGHCLTVNPPWARKGSGFTLLFEALAMELMRHMPVSVVARQMGVTDKRLWRVLMHYVDEALRLRDYSAVSGIGIDETSRKGHSYITVVVDLETRKVIFATEGKDHTTVDRFVENFLRHRGDPGRVRTVTCDMSLGFERGIADNFPNSNTVIDKFHVVKHANEAVDAVRKAECRENASLRKSKYLWLKNDGNLTARQREWKASILKGNRHLKTGRAYSMRVELQGIYGECRNRDEACGRLVRLCSWMMHSRLDSMKKFCRLLRGHWDEVLNYFDHRYTNAILEGINSKIQNVKRRARGFKNIEYFKSLIYLDCGGLDIDRVLANGIALV